MSNEYDSIQDNSPRGYLDPFNNFDSPGLTPEIKNTVLKNIEGILTPVRAQKVEN
jgi:hypothetical protein